MASANHRGSSRTNAANQSAAQIRSDGLRHAIRIIRSVCERERDSCKRDELGHPAALAALKLALHGGDHSGLFDWLMQSFSYQGVSDRAAAIYIEKHGSIQAHEIEDALRARPRCPRLVCYWTFDRCGYDKGSRTCVEPEYLDACPLPRHQLRNGRLNQTAYSLFLFIRDVAGGNLVTWIDQQIERSAGPSAAAANLIEALRNVFGVSDKVVAMSLATLFASAAPARPAWSAVGSQMIAIDTLVHNFLHRTGILGRLGVPHAYGPRCYANGGCADIIRAVSTKLDARRMVTELPADFRSVQHAIWRFCAAEGLNVCNGNMIDDKKPCQNRACQAFGMCDRVTLKSEKT